MSGFALLIVLLAAQIHATWNYFLKRANANRTFWWVVYLITTALALPPVLYFLWDDFSRVTPTGWLVIFLSAPIHVLYGVILQTGYRYGDYSIVYPTARGTGPLITVIAAVLILGNMPTAMGWLGIALILSGIVFLAQPTEMIESARPLKTGLFWGTLTGVCIAGYSFCDAWAVQQSTGLNPITFYFPSLAMRGLIFTPFILARPRWKEEVKELFSSSKTRQALAFVTVGSPGAYLLVLYVLTLAPLAYVAPTREVGMMAGVILGGLLLKERMTAKRLLGIALMTAGVISVGLSS